MAPLVKPKRATTKKKDSTDAEETIGISKIENYDNDEIVTADNARSIHLKKIEKNQTRKIIPIFSIFLKVKNQEKICNQLLSKTAI